MGVSRDVMIGFGGSPDEVLKRLDASEIGLSQSHRHDTYARMLA
jgi:hypothetical protein